MKSLSIYQQILDAAQNLIQTNGYNAFSYKDIAVAVGIKTSSIHYYFPTKADLGKEMVKRHVEALCNELRVLINNHALSCQEKLVRFIDSIVANTYLDQRKMCVGGMLASDVLTLPESIQNEVRLFFTRLQEWIKRLLTDAIQKNEFKIKKENIDTEALFLFSLIEGALLLARLFQDEEYLTIARRHVISRYCS